MQESDQVAVIPPSPVDGIGDKAQSVDHSPVLLSPAQSIELQLILVS